MLNHRFVMTAVLVATATAATASTASAEKGLCQGESCEPRVRKAVQDLRPSERADLVAAILRLKRVRSPWNRRLSYYDQFVAWHRAAFECSSHTAAHMTPAFLPWHRAFLLLFEEALREVSGKPITVPYWDWTSRRSTAAVFSRSFMGGGESRAAGYAVTNGPFRRGRWRLNVVDQRANDAYRFRHLVRRFGTRFAPSLPRASEVRRALAVRSYDAAPFDARSAPGRSFRNNIEGWRGVQRMRCRSGLMEAVMRRGAPFRLHNRVHVWVGGMWLPPGRTAPMMGTMALNTSPNDPVFWLHHAQVDRIWTMWSQRHGPRYTAGGGSHSHHGTGRLMLMQPFRSVGVNVRIADVLRQPFVQYARPGGGM